MYVVNSSINREAQHAPATTTLVFNEDLEQVKWMNGGPTIVGRVEESCHIVEIPLDGDPFSAISYEG